MVDRWVSELVFPAVLAILYSTEIFHVGGNPKSRNDGTVERWNHGMADDDPKF